NLRRDVASQPRPELRRELRLPRAAPHDPRTPPTGLGARCIDPLGDVPGEIVDSERCHSLRMRADGIRTARAFRARPDLEPPRRPPADGASVAPRVSAGTLASRGGEPLVLGRQAPAARGAEATCL